MAGLWCSSRARARSCGVSHREAHGRLKHKPPQRCGGMWLGMWDVPRGTGSVSRCSMIVLKMPRRLSWPNRAGSARYVHNNSIQPFVRTRSPTPVERCQPVVFWQWMVPTDTHGHSHSGDVGDHYVALTWSSVVDGRPDRHREVAGASCRTCAESAPQRAPTARKCTVRTTLATSAQAALLGGPFGHAEQAIRRHQDDLFGAVQR